MNIIYLLIPLSLVLVGAALAAFFWAVRSGQFDDLHTPALKVLIDDEPPVDTSSHRIKNAAATATAQKPEENR